jgi:aryl-alcohol dehydrogenase-like predicted oxidoreductase
LSDPVVSCELALGTVQFGLAYGIAGSGTRVPDPDARAILAEAHARGVRMLDTAAAYGDIEERLVDLFPAGAKFQVTSKIPPLPRELRGTDVAPSQAIDFVTAAIDRSAARLRGFLYTLLFHRAEDLDESIGPRLWSAAREKAQALDIRLGVSLYDFARVPSGCAAGEVEAIQCPANVLDQRILGPGALQRSGAEVHIRSAFLQGLLLMSPEDAARRLPAAKAAIGKWRDWCEVRGISPRAAALSFVKSLPARYCVVGVDSSAHFAEVAETWNTVTAARAPELASNDQSVTDPRNWQIERY